MDSPDRGNALKVVRPVVVALLLWTAFDMAYAVFGVWKQGETGAMSLGWDKLLIVALSFALGK